MAFAIYVAGPVIRPEPDPPQPLGQLYDVLETVAKNRGFELILPKYSPRLDELDAFAFAAEIRNRIAKVDALIAVIARPKDPSDLSGYSIAWEAQEANAAGKPVALLAVDQSAVAPRLLVALTRGRQHETFYQNSLNHLFDYLFLELPPRAK
jgi:nucleoside 2-deoxyribosyltransferase